MKTHNQTLQAANPAVRAGPYRPPARPAHIDLLLDGNEGIPPALDLAAVLGKSGPELLRRYPDTSVLQQLLATRHGQPADCVLPTAGPTMPLTDACASMPGRTTPSSWPTPPSR